MRMAPPKSLCRSLPSWGSGGAPAEMGGGKEGRTFPEVQRAHRVFFRLSGGSRSACIAVGSR